MSNFNEVIIGRSPHDEECLIKGLIRDFANENSHAELNGMGGVVTIIPIEQPSYVGDVLSDTNETSIFNG